MAAMAPAPPVPMARVMRLLDHDPIPLVPAPDQQRQQTGDEEEDAVHDAEGEAGLEHGARLGRADVQAVDGRAAQRAEGDGVRRAGGHVRAVGVRDEAQLVHAGDQGADEAQVHEGHEERVGARAVVREERRDGPGGREHGHDEQDQDVVRGEGVGDSVDVDEVGQHAEGGDLCGGRLVGDRKIERVRVWDRDREWHGNDCA